MLKTILAYASPVLFIASLILLYGMINNYNNYLKTFTAYNSALAGEESLRQQVQETQAKEEEANKRVSELEKDLSTARLTISLMLKKEASENQSNFSQQTNPQTNSETHTFTSSDGKVYSVSDEDYQRLLPIRQALVKSGAELDANNRNLNLQFNAHDSREIDQTNPYEVDSYNAEVNRLNASSTQLNEDYTIYNSKVDDFNTELERVGTLQK